jgi:hypothetical protein
MNKRGNKRFLNFKKDENKEKLSKEIFKCFKCNKR